MNTIQALFNAPSLKRFTAGFLAALLAAQALTAFANSTETPKTTVPELIPVVTYQGVALEDGCSLPMDAQVEVLYEFTAESELLNSGSLPIELPKPLKAFGSEPIEITATDGTDTFSAGSVTFGTDGNIALEFKPNSIKEEIPVELPLNEESVLSEGTDENPKTDEVIPPIEDSIPDNKPQEPTKDSETENPVTSETTDSETPITDTDTPADTTPVERPSQAEEEPNKETADKSEDSGLTVNTLSAVLLKSETPSETPSEAPSEAPSETPSEAPSETPSETPSEAPSEAPSETPSEAPSETPSEAPSEAPSETPSEVPSEAPSETIEVEEAQASLTISLRIPAVFDLSSVPQLFSRTAVSPTAQVVSLESGGKKINISLLAGVNGNFTDAVTVGGGHLLRGDVALKQGDEVSSKERLEMRYDFNIDEGKTILIKNEITSNPTKRYTVPCPNGIKWVGDTTHIIYGDFDDDNNSSTPAEKLQFGTLYVNGTNNTLEINFNGPYWNVADTLNNAYIEAPCALNMADIDKNETFEIVITGGDTFTITITDNKAVADKLEKTGTEYAGNRFNWIVTYTPEKHPAGTELNIVDTFSTTEQEFVAGSVKVDGVAIPDSEYTVVTDSTAKTTTLTYKVPAKAPTGTAIVLTYQTTLSDEAIEGSITAANNSVEIHNADGVKLGNKVTATANVKAESKEWITKVGRIDPSNDRQINWEIKIHSLDRKLDNLTLFDQIPAGLTLDESTVKVNGTPMLPNMTPTDITATFSLEIPKDVGDVYKPENTVTYSTKIGDDFFDGSTGVENFSNKAWLTFDWKHYNGDGAFFHEDYQLPALEKMVAVDTNILQKSFSKYDAATHKITWSVTVNPHKVDVVSGTITDDLTGKNQTYVAGSFKTAVGSAITLGSTSDTSVTVNVGALGKDTKSYTFETLVTNAADYAYNTPNGVDYTNTVVFDGFVNVGTPANAIAVTSKSTGKAKVTSTVLAKKSLGYDYSTNEITWEITLNQNGMPMKDTVLTDTMSAGQSYVAGSAQMGGTAIDSSKVSWAAPKLTLTFGDITKKETITYKTKVDTDTADFKIKPKLTFTNSVVLTRSEHTTPVTVTSTQEVANQVLSKAGKLVDKNSSIEYSVKVNPNQIPLPANSKLTDTIPKGLQVDIDSIKLYKATLDKAGNFTKTADAPSDINTPDFLTYYPENGSFTVAVPEGAAAYVLEYTCDITDSSIKTFKNDIKFGGTEFDESCAGDKNEIGAGGGGGGGGSGTSTKKASLCITKTDSMRTGVKLAGVQFELHTKIGTADIVMDSGTTDKDGKLTFYPLSIGREYTVVETKGLDGYTVDSFTATVKLEDKDKNTTVPFPVTNTPKTGTIEFTKLSDKATANDYVPVGKDEAEFKITDKTTGSTYTATVASGTDGKVTFINVPFGKYTVSETKTPQYHDKAADFNVEIKADGKTYFNNGAAVATGTETVNNKFYRPKFSLTKTDNSNKPMQGIKFELYQSGTATGTPVDTQTTAADGKLTFTPILIAGETYTVHEAAIPANYYPSADYTFTVNQGSDYAFLWKNYPYNGSITVSKTDSKRPAIFLKGAEYGLFTETNHGAGDIPLATGTTDENGKLTFDNLPLTINSPVTSVEPTYSNTNYYLREITAPTGYNLDKTEHKVTLTSSTPKQTVALTNEPKTNAANSFSFTKVNDWDIPVAGAVFTLTDTTPLSVYTETATSDTNGEVTFTNVPFGEYNLNETTAPTDHELNADTFKVTVFSDGTVSDITKVGDASNTPVTKITDKFHRAQIEITKTTEDGTTPLQGIVFTVKDANNIERGKGTTDAQGKISFSDLKINETYTISETPHEGYYPSEDYEFNPTTKDNTYVITWKNYPTQGKITLTKKDAVRTTDIFLKGAEYGLFTEAKHGENDIPLRIGATDEKGNIIFDKLPLNSNTAITYKDAPTLQNTTYYLRELTPPIGYVKDSNNYPVIIPADTQTAAITLTNKPIEAELNYSVINNLTGVQQRPIYDGEFTLTDVQDPSIVRKGATNRRGEIFEPKLPFGKYNLIQDKTDIYHSYNENPNYVVEVLPNAVTKIYPDGKPNEPITNNEIINKVLTNDIITTVFEKGTNIPLENVEVTITIDTNYSDVLDSGDKPIATNITNSNGNVEFKDLGLGETYFISEKVPVGYLPTATGTATVELKPKVDSTGQPVDPIKPVEVPKPQTPVPRNDGGAHGNPNPPSTSTQTEVKPPLTVVKADPNAKTNADLAENSENVAGDTIPNTGQNKKLMLLLGSGGVLMFIAGICSYRKENQEDDK